MVFNKINRVLHKKQTNQAYFGDLEENSKRVFNSLWETSVEKPSAEKGIQFFPNSSYRRNSIIFQKGLDKIFGEDLPSDKFQALKNLAGGGIEGGIGKTPAQEIEVSRGGDHGTVVSAQSPLGHGKGDALLFTKLL